MRITSSRTLSSWWAVGLYPGTPSATWTPSRPSTPRRRTWAPRPCRCAPRIRQHSMPRQPTRLWQSDRRHGARDGGLRQLCLGCFEAAHECMRGHAAHGIVLVPGVQMRLARSGRTGRVEVSLCSAINVPFFHKPWLRVRALRAHASLAHMHEKYHQPCHCRAPCWAVRVLRLTLEFPECLHKQTPKSNNNIFESHAIIDGLMMTCACSNGGWDQGHPAHQGRARVHGVLFVFVCLFVSSHKMTKKRSKIM